MSAEPEFYLIICPAGALSSRIYFRICDHPSALLVSPCKLPRSWLKFMASPAFHFFSSTVKSSWENCSNWLALEGNENLLSGYCACHLNALDDISTPGNASSPPQSSRVVWCFFFPSHLGTEVSNSIDPSAHFSILCTSLFLWTYFCKQKVFNVQQFFSSLQDWALDVIIWL